MKNYDAWNVNPDDFYKEEALGGKVEFLARFGILAPSSHNTQPWRFKISGNSIQIYADFSRKLPVSDKNGRMLYTALGCAAENVRIAACYYGLKTDISYNPELENSTPEYALQMTASGGPQQKQDEPQGNRFLIEAILKRSSYRGKYLDVQIQENILADLQKLNDKKGIHVNFFEHPAEKNRLSLIAGQGMKNMMSDSNFRKELAGWVKNNFTCKPDGMPGFTHGLSFLKTFLAPFVLKHKDVSEVEKRKIIKRVMNFPTVCIISSKQDNALSWVQSGEILERILVHAYAQDLGASIVAAPIEDRDAREELKKIAAEKSEQNVYPQVFFGFGYPQKRFPFSPRRKLEEVLIND